MKNPARQLDGEAQWRKRRRGTGLATVLVVTTLILTCAFTIVGIAYNHLSLTGRSNSVQQAHNLAEAAISRAIEKVLSSTNQAYGQIGGPPNATIVANFAYAPDGSYGAVSFDPTTTAVNGIALPTSYNNLGAGDAGQTFNGLVIPSDSFHLVGIGFCSGTLKMIDAMVYVPKFPYAMGTSGVVQSGGGLLLASLATGADPTNPANYLPGSVVSNAPGTSIDFAGATNITIYGDAQAAGGANFGIATVKGEERLDAQAQTLPTLSISSYNPSSQPGVQTLTGPAPSGSLVGYNQSAGPMTFPNGLNLNNGVLYVNGDLSVSGGGINGTGAIIATGNITVAGSGSLISDNQVGLLSGGNMSINGSPGSPQTVKGLIYSSGAVSAGNASLFGSVISNSGTSGGGGINITNSQMFANPQYAAPNVTVVPSTVNSSNIASGSTSTVLALAIASAGTGSAAPGTLTDVPVSLTVADAGPPPPARYLDTATNQYVFPVSSPPLYDPNVPNPTMLPAGNYISVINTSAVTGYSFQPYGGTVAPITVADLNVTINGTSFAATSSAAQTFFTTQLTQTALGQSSGLTAAQISPSANVYAVGAFSPAGLMGRFQSSSTSGQPNTIGQSGFLSSTSALLANYMAHSGGLVPAAPITFSINLNNNLSNDNILARNQAMRVLYWRDDL